MEMFALPNLRYVPSLILNRSVFLAKGLSDINTTFLGMEGSTKGQSRDAASQRILRTATNIAFPEANSIVQEHAPGPYSSDNVRRFASEVLQGASMNPKLGSLLGLQNMTAEILGSVSGTMQKERERLIPINELKDARIPHLSSSFASELHPCYEAVRKECEQWIVDIARPSNARAQKFLLDCELPRLVCLCLPIVPEHALPRLVQTAKMISWLLIADDENDDPSKMGSDCAQSVMAILYGNESIIDACHDIEDAENSPDLKAKRRFLDAFRQLWAEIQPSMSQKLRARFVSSMAAYLDSLKRRLGGPTTSLMFTSTWVSVGKQASCTHTSSSQNMLSELS
ncbi:hypothetical protein KP509_06G011400 [Ceratopteris richardii]|uniref:Uncharacterized protein n=1 Tax=Ceratopteris richardii TaxID=49495 RepID=A0A8T2UKC2_CERRI|nr:hypothetical protein KP509_06G011400 [Ceratopteris richardii]